MPVIKGLIDVEFLEGAAETLGGVDGLLGLGGDGHVQHTKLVVLHKLRLTRKHLLRPALRRSRSNSLRMPSNNF